jgi:hypothetical protein
MDRFRSLQGTGKTWCKARIPSCFLASRETIRSHGQSRVEDQKSRNQIKAIYAGAESGAACWGEERADEKRCEAGSGKASG